MKEEKEKLDELIDELTNYCLMNQVALFAIYAKKTDEGERFGHTVITPAEAGIDLEDDRITKYAASLNKKLILSYVSREYFESECSDLFDEIIDEKEE